MRRALVVVAGALAFVNAVPANAPAQGPGDTQAISGPTGKYYGYLTPVLVISKGGPITFTNIDLERHNVVQDVDADAIHGSAKRKWCSQFDPGKCPIFYSPLIGLSQSVPVQGTQYLKPGTIYSFYCTLHHGMQGKLVVTP
jgi:plastocyanin